MKQRLYLLFTLLLVAWLTASAYDFMVDGIAYNKNSNGYSVTITSGSIRNSGSLVIPEKVTYKGKGYSVTSIGEAAFWCCNGFSSLTIPNSVTSIGRDAFYACESLTSISIPNSVPNAGNRVGNAN